MNKLVFITGATAGIGEACARTFAAKGFNLIVTGRRRERLEKLSAQLQQEFGVEVLTMDFDIRERKEVEAKLESLPEDQKAIDILINNAGLSQGLDPFQTGNIDDWETMIDTNIKGFLYVAKTVANWMIARKSGHIINLGSIAGKEVYPNGNVYCATKHAVDALNKAMRIDLLPYGIKITGVHPGAVDTEFSEVRFKGDRDRAKKVYEGFKPLTAQDIADTILYTATLPPHVNINELTIMPTAQATATNIWRK